MSIYFNENECFNVRLHSSQIELIVNALKSLNNSNDDEEKDMLIGMFSHLEKDLLNSFVD